MTEYEITKSHQQLLQFLHHIKYFYSNISIQFHDGDVCYSQSTFMRAHSIIHNSAWSFIYPMTYPMTFPFIDCPSIRPSIEPSIKIQIDPAIDLLIHKFAHQLIDPSSNLCFDLSTHSPNQTSAHATGQPANELTFQLTNKLTNQPINLPFDPDARILPFTIYLVFYVTYALAIYCKHCTAYLEHDKVSSCPPMGFYTRILQ